MLAALLALPLLTLSCTDTKINLGNPELVFSARTLDDEKLYMATLEVNARNRSWVADAPTIGGFNGTAKGLKWRNRLGFVGVTWAAADKGVYDDGLNEAGLSVAQNQLDETVYPPVTRPGSSVGMLSVVGWLLGSAATVAEAKELLESVEVWGRAAGEGGDAGAERQHLHVLDAAGGELLVEWVDGEQHIYTNDPSNDNADAMWGTVTNSPAFTVQRAMRAYGAHFPTTYASPAVVVGGKGGLNGVPSAFDSMSRQARIRMVNAVVPKVTGTVQAVAWAFKVLDTVSVPGTPLSADAPLPADGANDFTQWEIVRDHTAGSRALYSRTWSNRVPKRLSFDSVDFTEGAPVTSYSMGDGAWFQDMSP